MMPINYSAYQKMIDVRTVPERFEVFEACGTPEYDALKSMGASAAGFRWEYVCVFFLYVYNYISVYIHT
jgi:hypothetical protein